MCLYSAKNDGTGIAVTVKSLIVLLLPYAFLCSGMPKSLKGELIAAGGKIFSELTKAGACVMGR